MSDSTFDGTELTAPDNTDGETDVTVLIDRLTHIYRRGLMTDAEYRVEVVRVLYPDATKVTVEYTEQI